MARGERDRRSARGGRSSNGKGLPREVDVSKKLSWLLRHGAEQQGLKLGTGGYVTLDKVLATQRLKSLNPGTDLAEIREIVETNSKQRFNLIHISDSKYGDAFGGNPSKLDGVDPGTDEEPSHWLIRANQGHSLKVETDDLLQPITLEAGNLPNTVVHGTQHQKWNQILNSGGLKPMTRNHVHFATGIPKVLESTFNLQSTHVQFSTGELTKPESASETQVKVTQVEQGSLIQDGPAPNSTAISEEVKSGMRNSSTLLVFINLKVALESGIKFWMSDNGVVLSEGNEKGVIPTEVFQKVIARDGVVLVEDGIVKNERN